MLDVATGKLLPDTLSPNRQGVAAWLKDNSGFFYTSYPPAEKGQELKATTYYQKLYFHKLGTPQSEDYVVYERPDNKEYFCGAEISEDGNWLHHHRRQRHRADEYGLFQESDHGKSARSCRLSKILIIAGISSATTDRSFTFRPIRDASRGKVVKVDALSKDRAWTDVIPESPDTLNGVQFVNNQFVLNYLTDAHTKIEIFETSGKFVREVKLPGIGSAGGFGGRRKDSETFYSYSSFNAPPTIYRYDMKIGQK